MHLPIALLGLEGAQKLGEQIYVRSATAKKKNINELPLVNLPRIALAEYHERSFSSVKLIDWTMARTYVNEPTG